MGAGIDARSKLDEPALSKDMINGNIDVARFLVLQGTHSMQSDLLRCAALRKSRAEGAVLAEEPVQKVVDVYAYCFDNPVARPLQINSRSASGWVLSWVASVG